MLDKLEKLTIRNALLLAEVVQAAQAGQGVRWLDHHNDVVEGVARSVGTNSGGFLPIHDDVRGTFLRITLRSGVDYYMPIADAMDRLAGNSLFFGK